MTSFISCRNFPGTNKITVSIDGLGIDAKKTSLEGDLVVQLGRARTEESHFDWVESNIAEVIIKNVVIYDDADVACLSKLIMKGIKIDCSNAFLSPVALPRLIAQSSIIEAYGVKVAEGSSIKVPIMGGYSGIGASDSAKVACEKLGFTVTQCL